MKLRHKIGFPVLILLFILWGCPPPGPHPRKGDAELETAISAHREAEGNKRIEARLRLDTLVRQYPNSELADNALLDIARSLLTEESFDKAITSLKEILDKYPSSDSASEARFLLGLAFFRSGRMAEAVAAFAGVDRKDPHWVDASIFYIDAMLKQDKVDEAIGRYVQLRKADPKRALEVEDALVKALEKMSSPKLEAVLPKLPKSPVGAYALFLLGKRAYDHGDFVAARKYMARLVTHHPDSPQAEQARSMLDDMENVGKINENALGIMLPLSGKWAPYGRKFLDGAALAIDAFGTTATQALSIRLEIADTAGDPERAAEAAVELAVEKRVIAIAGPIQRDTAKAAAKTAQAYGVPIVTMTQLEEITDFGSMVFRNSVTPRDQVKTVVWYAVTALGIRNFAVLFPDHSYGKLFRDVFIEEAGRQGGIVVLSVPYKHGQADLRLEIREIARRKREIEALFIPDSYMAAATIAPQLTYYNVVRLKLLGSSGWNNPRLIDLARGQMSSFEGATFPDAFFKKASTPITRQFVNDFEAAYGRKPGMYEAMGYETVRLLVEMITKNGVKNRPAMRDALASVKSFSTFSGYLAVQPDRSFHRPLFILQVRNGKIVDISATGEF